MWISFVLLFIESTSLLRARPCARSRYGWQEPLDNLRAACGTRSSRIVTDASSRRWERDHDCGPERGKGRGSGVERRPFRTPFVGTRGGQVSDRAPPVDVSVEVG